MNRMKHQELLQRILIAGCLVISVILWSATPATTANWEMATKPTKDDLAGGSPEIFSKAFHDAAVSSQFQPTAAFADAAKPLPTGTKLKIGFIFVGSQEDLGYNQAAFMGSKYLEKVYPNVEILRAENIPENAEVQRVAEQMIGQGAEIIFATSFGYSGPIKQIVDKYPKVVFLHQGDLEAKPNYGAYFGDIWQLQYSNGIAAGRMTKSNKMGFIGAFPIPQTLLNVNAFELGARSVNPKVQTTFVLTANWADPAKQVTAINTMAGSGIDVVTYQQDSTRALVEAAERKKMYVCGYHEDASPSAPNGWLTGAVWNWGPVYAELVGEIIKGTYRPSVMFAGLEAGWVKVARFGKSVPADLRKRVLDNVEGLRSGKIKPFTGPIKDQTGIVKIKDGVVPTSVQLQTIDWLMDGVIGRTK